MAYAKYWSDPAKGWPAANCFKWKLYVVQAAFWSDCIASCLIFATKKQRSVFCRESWTIPPHFSFFSAWKWPLILLYLPELDNKHIAYSAFYVCLVCFSFCFVQAGENVHFWRKLLWMTPRREFHCCTWKRCIPFVSAMPAQVGHKLSGKGCSHHKATITY